MVLQNSYSTFCHSIDTRPFDYLQIICYTYISHLGVLVISARPSSILMVRSCAADFANSKKQPEHTTNIVFLS